MNPPSRQTLRRDLRRRRRALTARERSRAARAVLRQLQGFLRFRQGLKIALYLAVDGELDTRPIIDAARRRGCDIYVPILRGARLWFVPLEPPFKPNRFRILEPSGNTHRRIDPRWLDAVLVPLVAFGPNGERLGSGAGFYDRTFAFLRRRATWRKPRFIGLAYEWQGVNEVKNEAWDVALSAVITDRGVHRFTLERRTSR